MNHKGPLTHEVLTTFLMEVSAILNARPLVAISTDPDAPQVLSPDMLIHQNCTYLTVGHPRVWYEGRSKKFLETRLVIGGSVLAKMASGVHAHLTDSSEMAKEQ